VALTKPELGSYLHCHSLQQQYLHHIHSHSPKLAPVQYLFLKNCAIMTRDLYSDERKYHTCTSVRQLLWSVPVIQTSHSLPPTFPFMLALLHQIQFLLHNFGFPLAHSQAAVLF
jgi:hypothetical protein